jgi:hypothetical protein
MAFPHVLLSHNKSNLADHIQTIICVRRDKERAWIGNAAKDAMSCFAGPHARLSGRTRRAQQFRERHQSPPAPRLSAIRKILMDECDRHASFAHSRSDALDWAQPDIAAREDAGHTRFKEIWISAQRPAPGLLEIVAG